MTALAEVQSMDHGKQEAFIGKALGNMSGAMATIMAAIGDRLGFFKSLAQHGPSTAAHLATRARVSERYVREWLGGMANAGYIDYDPKGGLFALPPEHAPVLADERGPVFFGGVHQQFLGALPLIDKIVDSFRTGRGVPQSSYNDNFWEGLERFTASWFENFLIQQWIPSMPDVEAKLEKGGCIVDVGCGRGRALIRLAEAYPKSFYTGFDLYPPSIEQARANAKTAGVDDRVRFEVLDAAKSIAEKHDVIF
ncbi:MAG: class I SAM-dependent methyltransferase, partial [Thermoanaerobaculia bacterium]